MYVKLFGTILDSSVWSESPETCKLWITMLCMADADGFVESSESGLARRAVVGPAECRAGLKVLSEPDLDSKSQEYGGRRIEKVDGGWVILNYKKYREIRTKEQVQAARRQARRRAKQREEPTVTGHASHARSRTEEEAEAEGDVGVGEDSLPSVEIGIGDGRPTVESPNGKQPSRSLARRPSMTHQEVLGHLAAVFAEVDAGTQRRLTADQLRDLQAEVVFAYWQSKLDHKNALIDPKRRNRLKARLKENGGNVSELLYAVNGALRDPNLMGQNERNQKYDRIETIFRDRGQVERLSELGGYTPGKVHPRAAKIMGIDRGGS